jgi:hypothetical protein
MMNVLIVKIHDHILGHLNSTILFVVKMQPQEPAIVPSNSIVKELDSLDIINSWIKTVITIATPSVISV